MATVDATSVERFAFVDLVVLTFDSDPGFNLVIADFCLIRYLTAFLAFLRVRSPFASASLPEIVSKAFLSSSVVAAALTFSGMHIGDEASMLLVRASPGASPPGARAMGIDVVSGSEAMGEAGAAAAGLFLIGASLRFWRLGLARALMIS